MSTEHPNGRALNIVQFVEEKLQFDKSELDSLLLHPQVKDRKIVVFTIVGAFRKGKSFFMDYCLRFMYANVSFNLISKSQAHRKLLGKIKKPTHFCPFNVIQGTFSYSINQSKSHRNLNKT